MKKEDFSEKIGLKIREERLKKNITQEELASISQTNVKYISDIELGKKLISTFKLYVILESLNVSLSEFFKSFS